MTENPNIEANQEINENGLTVFELEESVYAALSPEEAFHIAETMHSNTLIRLPKSEILFFEWVKENDPKVWSDLWESDQEDPYLVGIAFLPALIDKNKGYLICDLISTDNYYFTHAHILDKESDLMLDSVKKRLLSGQSLTVAQLLLLNISMYPTDIWHFAYRNKIALTDAKNAVNTLVEDNLIVHLKDAEHLSVFIDQ